METPKTERINGIKMKLDQLSADELTQLLIYAEERVRRAQADYNTVADHLGLLMAQDELPIEDLR